MRNIQGARGRPRRLPTTTNRCKDEFRRRRGRRQEQEKVARNGDIGMYEATRTSGICYRRGNSSLR